MKRAQTEACSSDPERQASYALEARPAVPGRKPFALMRLCHARRCTRKAQDMKSNQTARGLDDKAAVGTEMAVGIIVAVIVIVIGVSLVGTVADESAKAQAGANVTGATDSLVGLVPLIFVAGLIIGTLFLFFSGRIGGG